MINTYLILLFYFLPAPSYKLKFKGIINLMVSGRILIDETNYLIALCEEVPCNYFFVIWWFKENLNSEYFRWKQ